jgi:hypothetical protein
MGEHNKNVIFERNIFEGPKGVHEKFKFYILPTM